MRVDNRSKTIKRFTLPASFLLFPVGMDDQNNLWFFNPKRTQFLKTDGASQEVLAGIPLDSNLPEFGTSVSFTNKCQVNSSGEGRCWFLGTNKFYKNFPIAWDFQKNTNYNFEDKIVPLLSYKKTEPNISDACLDKDNRLWLSTDDGVLILNLKKNNFTTITAPNGENYSSRSIAEDNNGIVHIATYSGWLQLHPEKGLLKTNELSRNTLYVAKDPEGAFWYSTGRATIKYDPVTGKSRYYSHNDTLGQSRSIKRF